MSFPIGPPESSVTKLSLALLLRDRLTFADALVGDIGVTAGSRIGERKGLSGTFLFFGLGPGSLDFSVRSAPDTPYYLPLNIRVTVPMPSPLWPAFPDITLADPILASLGPKPAYAISDAISAGLLVSVRCLSIRLGSDAGTRHNNGFRPVRTFLAA